MSLVDKSLNTNPTTGNPNKDALITVSRYAIFGLTIYLANKFERSREEVEMYIFIAIGAITALYGAWRSHNFSAQLKELVESIMPEDEDASVADAVAQLNEKMK